MTMTSFVLMSTLDLLNSGDKMGLLTSSEGRLTEVARGGAASSDLLRLRFLKTVAATIRWRSCRPCSTVKLSPRQSQALGSLHDTQLQVAGQSVWMFRNVVVPDRRLTIRSKVESIMPGVAQGLKGWRNQCVASKRRRGRNTMSLMDIS